MIKSILARDMYLGEEQVDDSADTAQKKLKTIQINNLFGYNNIQQFQWHVNRTANYKSCMIFVEQDTRDTSIVDRWRWNIALQGTGTFQSTIYLQELPSNIIGIKLVSGRLVFNSIPSYVADNERVALLIDEFIPQASKCGQQISHFIVRSELVGADDILDPNIINYGAYYFQQPVISTTSWTISVFDPIQRIIPQQVQSLKLVFEIIYLGGQLTV